MSFLQKIYARYSVVSDISDISKSPNMQILPKKIGTTYSPAQVVKYIKSVDPLENKMGRDTSFRSVVAKHKIFTTKKVAIADIEIPTKYPHRVNREFAEHYAKLDPKTVPMVVLEFHKPIEKYIILDGRHRIWAAKLRKEKYIFALVGDGQLSYLKAVQANSEEQSPLKKALVSWVEGKNNDLLQLYNAKPECFPTSKTSTKIMYRAVGLDEDTFNDIMDGETVQPQHLLESWTSSKSAVKKHMTHLLDTQEDLVAVFKMKPKKILLKVYDYLKPSDADFDYSAEDEYIIIGESLATNNLLLVKDADGETWYKNKQQD